MQSTYFSFLFLRQLRSCDFCFCFVNMVYGVYINVEKSNLKQFNIRQERYKTWKKLMFLNIHEKWILSQGTVYAYIYTVVAKILRILIFSS